MTPDGSRLSLAVVVVSYNVRDLLRSCLAQTYACLARSPELDVTVWVADNASTDGSAALVSSEFPQARLISSPENLGFAAGNNLTLRRLGFETADAQADLVLLLNPDAEPLNDAIGRMATFLREHPRVGGAGAQLLYPDGSFQHGAFRFPGLWQLWFDLFPPRPRRLLDSRLNGRYPRSLYETGRPFAIDFALGAALMVRREAIQAAGLLDEGYFMYAEEVDWCWRIQRAGWPFYCVPAAKVVHHSGGSTRQFRARSFLSLWRSRRRLYARFYGPVRRWAASRIVQLGMGAELRRARGLASRGEIGSDDLREREEVIRQVQKLFRAEMREA
jgi:N-acetylglucosaminyl-diphospho-decaprenol L-rhamnosyltransferase